MQKLPKEITLCRLDCVLMPQGEVICQGKTIGWFKDLQSHLEEATVSADLLEACKKLIEIAPKLWGDDMGDWPMIINRFEQAIEKAT